MKLKRPRASIRKFWMLGILTFGAFAALPAGAQTLQSFALDEYYIGHGGTPPSLADFGADPKHYLRSDAAYRHLKEGFEKALQKPLTDEAFEELFRSDSVQRVMCVGDISTAGVNLTTGNIGWKVRSCYIGEYLIQVKTVSGWVTVASQGCFNLVRPIVPKPKKPKSCRWVLFSDAQTQGTHIHADGTFHQNCCCPEHSSSTPGYSGFIENTLQSSGGYQQCN